MIKKIPFILTYYDKLETTIREFHPYETPEIIAVDIEKGFKGYLEWIDDVTK